MFHIFHRRQKALSIAEERSATGEIWTWRFSIGGQTGQRKSDFASRCWSRGCAMQLMAASTAAQGNRLPSLGAGYQPAAGSPLAADVNFGFTGRGGGFLDMLEMVIQEGRFVLQDLRSSFPAHGHAPDIECHAVRLACPWRAGRQSGRRIWKTGRNMSV